MLTRLTRSAAGTAPAAPVRCAHLGLGNFHRAHQAWYAAADPGWGIAAYTFRSTELPRALDEQDGLFSLLVRGEDADSAEVVASISRAHPGTDEQRWLSDLASAEVAVLTLTVTEAAYRIPRAGEDSAVSRIASGLRARFRADAAPLAIVPCDNVPDNAGVLREVLRTALADDERSLREWFEADVSVVGTVVDRITPATADEDLSAVAELTGFRDSAPVVTEPFTEWLLAGNFPGARPAWERAGARFVDDVEPYERRKLRLLNGAHTLLAYAGLGRGLGTVREAVDDDQLAELVASWWDTASLDVPLPAAELADYRRQLFRRFAAPGIRHRLEQIAAGGSQKIPARWLPALRAERARGRLPPAVVTGLAAWLDHLRVGEQVRDPRADELVPLARSSGAARSVLAALDREMGDDVELVAAVAAETGRFSGTI